jgi:RNA polymerase sigma-70 factor, ECF subfamily
MKDKTPSTDSVLREMAALWVRSQAIVSAYITANVIDLHHAEDLIQETAKAVAESFSSYDNSRPFTPWVLAIARNQILKYYRTRSRDRIVLSESALVSIGGALERIEYEAEDRRQALRICLERIRGRSRKVLEMRYESDMKTKEIGDSLGIAASTVSVMLFRIRAILEKCIRLQLARETS